MRGYTSTHTHKCVFFTTLQEVWVPCVQGMCRVRCWRGEGGGKILLSVCLRLPQHNCQPHMWSCVITPIGQPQTLRLPNYFHQSRWPIFGVATTDTHLWATTTSSTSLSLSISIISIKKDCNGGLILATHLVISKNQLFLSTNILVSAKSSCFVHANEISIKW